MMQVVVAGAGLIGASVAWQLSRAGARVTVLDVGYPGASQASFGWVNGSFYADAAHHRLRVAGMAAWGRLSEALPTSPISHCGALWWEEQGEALRAFQLDLQGLDYAVQHQVEAAVSRMEPNLAQPPAEALFFPKEAGVEPGPMASLLLAASGARVVRGARVLGILGDRHVTGVQTSLGPVAADRVVVAAGTGTPDILESAGVALPMLHRPGVLVTTGPTRAKLNHILVTPHGEVRQLPDGRILASAVAGHQGDETEVIDEALADIASRVLGWLDPMIAGETLDWEEVSVADRPMPADGLPVIGQAGPEGCHVAVMHSGVTLAAIVGEVTAAEVLGQATKAQIDIVAPYRSDRFK